MSPRISSPAVASSSRFSSRVCSDLPPGETFQLFDVSPGTSRVRRDRRREPAPRLAPLLDRGRQGRDPVAAVPLRVALGARPHGAARGDDAARALGGLAAPAVHEREREARLGVGEAVTLGRATPRRRLVRVDATARRHLVARGRARRRRSPDGRTRTARSNLGRSGRHSTPVLAPPEAAARTERAGALARRRRRRRGHARDDTRPVGPAQVAERRDAAAPEGRRLPRRGA